MKTKEFFDINQASQYLRHSVISVAKKPVYVHDVQNEEGRKKSMQMTFSPLEDIDKAPKAINIHDEDVDMNPVNLGMVTFFVNNYWNTYYAQRIPSRKWKIGLTQDNLALVGMFGKVPSADYSRYIYPRQPLAETIMGSYMKPDEAMAQLKRSKGVIPLSRRFAISSDGYLLYKTLGDPIGGWKSRTKEVFLDNDYSYLQEALAEDLK